MAETVVRLFGATTRVVTLRNTVHVTTEGDTYLVAGAECGRRVIRAFVRTAHPVVRDAARAGRLIDCDPAGREPAPATTLLHGELAHVVRLVGYWDVLESRHESVVADSGIAGLA